MSIHKITPFLSDIKDFFKNSDMTAAMQNISSILGQVKMTERDTLAVTKQAKLCLPVADCIPMSSSFSHVSALETHTAIRSMVHLIR